MMREAFSVSPGGSDGEADLSQFCDSDCVPDAQQRSSRCCAEREPEPALENAEIWAPALQPHHVARATRCAASGARNGGLS